MKCTLDWVENRVAEYLFLTMERILLSSTTVILCGHPAVFVLLSSLVHSFFLRMYKNVDFANTYLLNYCYLADGFFPFLCSLKMACFTPFSSFDRRFTASASICECHTWNKLHSFYLLNWWKNNEGISHNCS